MDKRFKKLKEWLPRTQRQQFVFGVTAAFLLLIIAGAVYKSTREYFPGPLEAEIITYSTDTPDETKPGDGYVWRGGANDPKKVIIPSVGIDGFIQKVGVDQNRQVAVPNNVHIAGWFVDSVRPGEKGLSIIDGHVDGRLQDGAVFKRLPEVKKDAEIAVEFGDGSSKTFRVISVTTVPESEAAGLLFSQDPVVSSQLNLITCSGRYINGGYDHRTIVSAELVE